MTDLLAKHSFVELGARQRAKVLLDAGTFRELIDPFQRVMSPWLSRQGVVPLPMTVWSSPRAASAPSLW